MASLKNIFPVIILVTVVGCSTPSSEKKPGSTIEGPKTDIRGSFTISGAYALYPLISRLAADFTALYPGVKIEVLQSGSGKGIESILSGECQLAMISRPLTDEEMNAGVWVIPVAKDGVAPIVNQKNPNIERIIDQGLSPDEFLHVFSSGKQVTWGELLDSDSKDKVTVFTRADQSGAAEVFASFLFKSAVNLKGTPVTGDAQMIESVQNNPLSIGFCNLSYAFDNITGEKKKDIQVVPCDLDFNNKIKKTEAPFNNIESAHRSLWLGYYPQQLCRELSIGSMGKPSDPAVREFIYYVLGEGQKKIQTIGYCPLNNVYIRHSLDRLK